MLDVLNILFTARSQPGSEIPPLTVKKNGSEVSYPFKLKYITTKKGIRLGYTDQGKQKETLLFIHGIGTGLPVWKKNIEALKKDYRCIAVDLPGHGASDKNEYSYTITFYTQVIADFIEALDLSSVTVIGHSMGGQIAVHVAHSFPEKVKKLVLINPSGVEPYMPYEKQMLAASIATLYNYGGMFAQNHMNIFNGLCFNSRLSSELLGQLAFFKHNSVQYGEMVSRSAHSILRDPVDKLVPQLSQPCLMLVGEQDQVSAYTYLRPSSYADIVLRIYSGIKNVRIVLLANGGHFLQFQQPEEVNRQIQNFLKINLTTKTRKHENYQH